MTEPEIIYPNFRRVQSGVSTTVFNLAPALLQRGATVYLVGWGIPDHLSATSIGRIAARIMAKRDAVEWLRLEVTSGQISRRRDPATIQVKLVQTCYGWGGRRPMGDSCVSCPQRAGCVALSS